jgi:hypothetical protein
MTSQVAELRMALRRAGFDPLPLDGKVPSLKRWQKQTGSNDISIGLWDTLYPYSTNTGALTKRTPALDLDILNPNAADAAEELVRERFEKRGFVLTRIGRAPKRAILFRTDEPFAKIAVSLVAPNGGDEKVELLCDGQQVACFGIHPDTKRPYSWFGGEPGKIAREDLPYIAEAEARQLVDDIVELLVRDYGYQRKTEARSAGTGNGKDDTGARERFDWGKFGDLLDHDNLVSVAMALTAGGLGTTASFNLLRSRVEAIDTPDTERKQRRLDELRGIVDSAAGKKPDDPGPQPIIKSSAQFVAGFVPPDYILDGLLQQSFLYSLTGQTGAGKTSITLRLAASIAEGNIFAGRETKKCRVLYLAAENPDDARMRWIALAPHMDFDLDTIEVFFSDTRFTISKMKSMLCAELARHGGEFGLVIVDTGPSFFEGDDESNRVQMLAHAKMFRSLIELIPGRPCIVVNCHPIKNAAADNLLPAGGGTFLNEMDGNLTASKTESTVELHWQGKFRGPEFAPMHFLIKTITHPRLKDKKEKLIPTCLAEWISEQATEEIAAQKNADENRVLEHISWNPKISLAGLATAMDWKLYNGEPNKMKAQRCVKSLVTAKFVKVTRDSRLLTTPAGQKALKGEVETEDQSAG